MMFRSDFHVIIAAESKRLTVYQLQFNHFSATTVSRAMFEITDAIISLFFIYLNQI